MPVKKIVFYIMCAILAITIIISGITIGKASALIQGILNPQSPSEVPTSSATGTTEDAENSTPPTDTSAPSETTEGSKEPQHQHTYTTYQVSPATCTEEGYTLYKCDCGDIETRDVVDALGHSYGAGQVFSFCVDKQGYTQYICSRCNHIDKRDFTDPTGHKFDIIVEEFPATCEKDAYTVRKCSNPNCNESETEILTGTSFGGHDFSVLKEEVKATCTENGYKLFTCANPGCTAEPHKEIINATGHKFIQWEESGNGMKTVCEKDGCDVSIHSSELEITDDWSRDSDDGSYRYYVIELGTKNIRRLYTYDIEDKRSESERTQNPVDYSEIDLKEGLIVKYASALGDQRIPLGFTNDKLIIEAAPSAPVPTEGASEAPDPGEPGDPGDPGEPNE